MVYDVPGKALALRAVQLSSRPLRSLKERDQGDPGHRQGTRGHHFPDPQLEPHQLQRKGTGRSLKRKISTRTKKKRRKRKNLHTRSKRNPTGPTDHPSQRILRLDRRLSPAEGIERSPDRRQEGHRDRRTHTSHRSSKDKKKRRRRGGAKHQNRHREQSDPFRRSYRKIRSEKLELATSLEEGLRH
eukprot:s145_g7.t1